MYLLLVTVVIFSSWIYVRWRHVKGFWARRNVPHHPPHPILGGLTFLQRENPEPLWSYLRRRLTVVFTAAKLRALQNLISTKTEQLSMRIRNDISQNKFIDIRSLYADYTTDIIGAAAFGVNGEATLTGESPLRSVTKTFMEYNLHRGLSWSSIFFFPELVDIFRFSLFPKSSTEYFRRIFRTVVKERGGYENSAGENRDLLDALRKLKYEADQKNEEITEDMLIAQAAIFLFGGFDTTAVTLTYLTLELAYNPHVQEKLYIELQEAKERSGGEDLDATTLTEINYMTAVIKETMRIFPSMGWMDRISSVDYRIDENLVIPAGTPVYINAAGIHLDDAYHQNPGKFDPDRFMPKNELSVTPFTYLPFGEGPRSCIGKRFAYNTMRRTVASVVLNYKLIPLPGYNRPEECSIEKRGLFLAPDRPLSIQFVPRS
ncbi:cytochrome P450 3A18-like isoform X2 [Achroia grisella]|uniref:cytochrome P450 3A18-like isoform X2 n=1 Tax=Achroia grisella TaxID=688607 RepID=UPI0027D20EB5|nr:cytochrome P450 3A18-like isoform X2 [Achroia grisella]